MATLSEEKFFDFNTLVGSLQKEVSELVVRRVPQFSEIVHLSALMGMLQHAATYLQLTVAFHHIFQMSDILLQNRHKVPPIIGAGGFGIVEVVTVRTKEEWFALKSVKKVH